MGIGFIVVGTIISTTGGLFLGLVYLALGIVAVPLLPLPYGFRTLAILLGAVLL